MGTFDPYDKGGVIKFYTDDELYEGIQQTYIRGCSRSNQIYEILIPFEVKRNTAPYFDPKRLKQKFTLEVGEIFSYAIPSIVDSEANDDIEVYVRESSSKGSVYPPFLHYSNNTRELTFRPHSIYY